MSPLIKMLLSLPVELADERNSRVALPALVHGLLRDSKHRADFGDCLEAQPPEGVFVQSNHSLCNSLG